MGDGASGHGCYWCGPGVPATTYTEHGDPVCATCAIEQAEEDALQWELDYGEDDDDESDD